MKVKELIEALMKFDGESEVDVFPHGNSEVDTFYIDDIRDDYSAGIVTIYVSEDF